jgi:hypothetical protein
MCTMAAECAEIHPLYVSEAESDTQPMSVGLFKQVSCVTGFFDVNGCRTYNEYITRWMERRDVKADPRSPNYDSALELLKCFTAATLITTPFATITADGRESTQTLDPLPHVIDNTVMYAFLDRVTESHQCTEPLKWISNGYWRNDDVCVRVHPTAMLLIEWAMVLAVNTDAAMQPVVEQFARWVQSACTDSVMCARARALRT